MFMKCKKMQKYMHGQVGDNKNAKKLDGNFRLRFVTENWIYGDLAAEIRANV